MISNRSGPQELRHRDLIGGAGVDWSPIAQSAWVEDFAQALRAIGEPIHSRTADQISMAKLLTLLFEITSLFEMTTRIELVMLQKTMVVVEGVARKLDPQLNMWSTAEPVVGAWIAENLGPIGRIEDAGRIFRLSPRSLPTRRAAWSRSLIELETESRPTAKRKLRRSFPTHAPIGVHLCFDWLFTGALVHGGVPMGHVGRRPPPEMFAVSPRGRRRIRQRLRAPGGGQGQLNQSLHPRAANTTIVIVAFH